MHQVRSTTCNVGVQKKTTARLQMRQLRRCPPGQIFRLSFISTTQLLTSTTTVPAEDNTCFSVQASSISSSQAADVSTPTVYNMGSSCISAYNHNGSSVDKWKTNLMSLAILFHLLCAQHVSDINISIFRSPRLCWWITTSVVLFSVRCVLQLFLRLIFGGVRFAGWITQVLQPAKRTPPNISRRKS